MTRGILDLGFGIWDWGVLDPLPGSDMEMMPALTKMILPA
jgi:hypothetical protein